MIETVNLSLLVLSFLCLVILMIGIRAGLNRTPLKEQSNAIVAKSFGLILFWLIVLSVLSFNGTFTHWQARPPRLLFVPLSALLSIILLQRTRAMKLLLTVIPTHWPVALQTFRIGVEVCFWGLVASGNAPELVSFQGRNFDILVGLSAPIMALLILKIKLKPGFAIAWNGLGLLILMNTVFTTLTAMPGPLHIERHGEIFTAFAFWPFIWIPGFLAPLAVALHIFSARQYLIKDHLLRTSELS